MSYVALYRSYRPSSFSEVAGQDPIKKTLQNALKHDKVAHAYLFCGPRGTGKTTIAKILAKAVNCSKGHEGDPCNSCDICRGINDGSIGDVIEIDAASNNGVDEIREIRDKVKYLPSVGKYKVYIIDEVHMLSTGAFNALLKTLEEPPKHVIFILATTEPYKIPSTIISRCQRFDFKGISVLEIEKKLKEIISKEGILIEEEAIRVIAESADGGMRDALSLLDQVISYSDEKITAEDVHKVNGSVSENALISLVQASINKENAKALSIVDDLLGEGKEISRIVNDLIQFYRDLLIYKNIGTDNYKAIFDNDSFRRIAKTISNQRIYFFLNILNETQNNIKWTNQKQSFLEMALIKMNDDVELKEVLALEKIGDLEKRIKVLEEGKSSEIKKEEPKVIVQKVQNSPSNQEDIHKIEDILANADKEKKAYLQKGWAYLEKNDSMIIQMLAKSELVAYGNEQLILVYPDLASCNHMLKSKSKNEVLSFLNRKNNLVSDYCCVTEDEWGKIQKEFIDQWKNGIKHPSLKEIHLSALKEEIKIEPIKKEKTASELAREFFGEGVLIKEE